MKNQISKVCVVCGDVIKICNNTFYVNLCKVRLAHQGCFLHHIDILIHLFLCLHFVKTKYDLGFRLAISSSNLVYIIFFLIRWSKHLQVHFFLTAMFCIGNALDNFGILEYSPCFYTTGEMGKRAISCQREYQTKGF